MVDAWVEKREIGPCTLYLGDALLIAPHLAAPDLVYTSPPYWNQRTYGKPPVDWNALVPPIIAAIPRHATTQLLINLGLVRKKKIIPYWDTLIARMAADGVDLRDWYVWNKLNAMPGDFKEHLAPQHEFIFHFAVGSMTLRKTVPCKDAGKPAKKTAYRNARGVVCQRSNLEPIRSHKVLGSVIDAHPEQRSQGYNHPAMQCLSVPSQLLAAFAPRTVLDPFVGTGTTCLAAQHLGIASVGIEIDPTHYATACARIDRAWAKQQDAADAP